MMRADRRVRPADGSTRTSQGGKIAESVSTSSKFSFRLALECTSLRQRTGLEAVSDACVLWPIVKLDRDIFYYPSLDQWFSFGAGLLVLFANSAWLL